MFSPAVLGGLKLWLRSSDLGADGETVSEWINRANPSDVGELHLTSDYGGTSLPPVVLDNATLSGAKSAKFRYGAYLNYDVGAGNTQGEIIAFVRSDGHVSGGYNTMWRFGNDHGDIYPLNDIVWTSYGSPTQFNVATLTAPQLVTIQGWHIYRIQVKADGTHTHWINGTQIHSSNRSIGFAQFVNIGGSSYSVNTTSFKGQIAELIHTNQVLTDDEAADVAAYFTERYITGLEPNPPTDLEATTIEETLFAAGWMPPDSGSEPTSFAYRLNSGSPIDAGLAEEIEVAGLEPATPYTFEVRTESEEGNSPWSDALMVTTLAPPPSAPIVWDVLDERYYSHGTDRGVLYSEDGAVPWNGIIGVTEAGAGEASVYYRDGHIYYTAVEPGDYSGSLTADFWPKEFDKCLGMPEIAPGFHADYQRPRQFSLSYRSLIGSGSRGDMFGYQIHLIYNATASAQSRSRKTDTDTISMDEFSFDLVATPPRIRGYRPTAHFVIDTRNLTGPQIEELEAMLYSSPTLPDPTDIYELLKFGDTLIFTDLGEGHIQATGASSRISVGTDGKITILNVDAVLAAGKYTLSDTP